MSSVSHLALAAVLFRCALFGGCDAFFVGFVSNPGGSQTVSGTVGAVQLNFLRDTTGETITFTAVTFLNPGTATTINFCGDQRDKFPENRPVRADFNTGISCSALVTVVVIT